MSELTLCNFCTLRRIRRRYKGMGTRVLTRYNSKWGMGGANIYAIPKGVHVPEGGIVEGSPFHEEYFICWLMEIPKSCMC